ncbi:MAG: YeeE/YedE family protein [candidate division KSB1 bacterium]|nr:YeeE/YedE family protein [candidate division KSB1 bacterium]
MNAPFYKYGLFNDEVSLIVAVLIGIGFGFFLERAGFGSARKLAAQFYFTDMTVLKVMFTAIVTAMIGLYYLSVFGVVDLSLVYLTPTYLLPQVVGGLLLGFGFVIGGYCPGTSCVAAATGKYDGWVYLLGMFLGILVFGELFPLVEKFYYMTPMGTVTLPQVLGLPYGLIVFLVSVMAVGAFAAAEWGERKMAAKKAEEKS